VTYQRKLHDDLKSYLPEFEPDFDRKETSFDARDKKEIQNRHKEAMDIVNFHLTNLHMGWGSILRTVLLHNKEFVDRGLTYSVSLKPKHPAKGRDEEDKMINLVKTINEEQLK
jgi:hypothetical protein